VRRNEKADARFARLQRVPWIAMAFALGAVYMAARMAAVLVLQ
jgi:hypothetical protein